MDERKTLYKLRQDILHLERRRTQNSDIRWNAKLWLNILSIRMYPVLVYRFAYAFKISKLRIFAKILSTFNFVVFGIEISLDTEIEGGLILPHTQGTVIGATKIGKNCIIYQGVTLGAKELDFESKIDLRPTLLDDVIVGAGAKVLGGICIGDNVVVKANSVITSDLSVF